MHCITEVQNVYVPFRQFNMHCTKEIEHAASFKLQCVLLVHFSANRFFLFFVHNIIEV